MEPRLTQGLQGWKEQSMTCIGPSEPLASGMNQQSTHDPFHPRSCSGGTACNSAQSAVWNRHYFLPIVLWTRPVHPTTLSWSSTCAGSEDTFFLELLNPDGLLSTSAGTSFMRCLAIGLSVVFPEWAGRIILLKSANTVWSSQCSSHPVPHLIKLESDTRQTSPHGGY